MGDLSLLAARIAGPQGCVLGMDRSASSLEIARHRAQTLGRRNVAFLQSDLDAFETEREFDALVGRLVLLYLPDPATTLRRLVGHVRAQGIVAFQEFDMSPVSQVPTSPLFAEARRCILEAFLTAGARIDMGTELYAAFRHAGLAPPGMFAATLVACGPETPAYDYMVRVLKSLLPVIERYGIGNPRMLEVETLAQRLRDEAFAHERIAFMPRIVGAWSHVGTPD